MSTPPRNEPLSRDCGPHYGTRQYDESLTETRHAECCHERRCEASRYNRDAVKPA